MVAFAKPITPMNTSYIPAPTTQSELRLDRAVKKADSGQPVLPQDEMRLAAAWEKLHRARALLEVEQGQLCHERSALDRVRMDIHRRETNLTERETALAEAEQRLQAPPVKPKSLFGFTRAPFGFGKASTE